MTDKNPKDAQTLTKKSIQTTLVKDTTKIKKVDPKKSVKSQKGRATTKKILSKADEFTEKEKKKAEKLEKKRKQEDAMYLRNITKDKTNVTEQERLEKCKEVLKGCPGVAFGEEEEAFEENTIEEVEDLPSSFDEENSEDETLGEPSVVEIEEERDPTEESFKVKELEGENDYKFDGD